MLITHPFEPIYNEKSRILILGSFPSVRSRADGFYYGHPQNRFWKVMGAVYHTEVPQTTEEKIIFLYAHGIALWDVIASCEIENSADSSIRNAVPNDLSKIFDSANIHSVFTNGKTADKLYRKFNERKAICLPSTSPANAAWTLAKISIAWKIILEE